MRTKLKVNHAQSMAVVTNKKFFLEKSIILLIIFIYFFASQYFQYFQGLLFLQKRSQNPYITIFLKFDIFNVLMYH